MLPASTKLLPNCQLTAEVRLIRPQFGGGAVTRKVDQGTWLRPASVRGALRFWWRALVGHQYASARALRDEEDKIFGSPDKLGRNGPGALWVTVSAAIPGTLKPFSPGQESAESVAYFPAQSNNNLPAAALLQSGTATVSIGCRGGRPLRDDAGHPRGHAPPAWWSGVVRAFVTWVTLGGSGSRTRRGAGALAFAEPSLRPLDAPTSLAELRHWLADLPLLSGPAPVGNLFLLARREAVYVSKKAFPDASVAHIELLKLWRGIRQDRDHPTNWQGAQGWGRSRWPEADAVRLLTGTHATWSHGVAHQPDERNRGRAPRAHLGLPIGIKFKDDQLGHHHHHQERGALVCTEPARHELVAVRDGQTDDEPSERYASPVLLCVVGLSQGAAGVVLVTQSLLDGSIVARPHAAPHLAPGPWHDVLTRIRASVEATGQFDSIQ